MAKNREADRFEVVEVTHQTIGDEASGAPVSRDADQGSPVTAART